jgi:hypothetical protein
LLEKSPFCAPDQLRGGFVCVIHALVALPIGALFAAVLFLYAKENADIRTS